MKKKRQRRTFSREFKLEAVRMVTQGGHRLSQVARDLDLRADQLRRWKKQFEEDGQDAFPGNGRLKGEAQRLRELERENQRLRMEREILKKALTIFSEPPR